MKTERDVLEALRGQFEASIRSFEKPKGGQHVGPSACGDFWPVGVGVIQRYKWWNREIDHILTQSPTQLEMNELRERAEEAEAKLAALREAAQHVRWGLDPDEIQPDHAPNSSGGGWRDLVAKLDAALEAAASTVSEIETDRETKSI